MTRAPNDWSLASSAAWVRRGRRSRWTLFFTVLGSPTPTKTSRGRASPGGSTTQNGLPGISCFEDAQPVTALQNLASNSGSAESNVTFKIEQPSR